jgi:hypothetical protein
MEIAGASVVVPLSSGCEKLDDLEQPQSRMQRRVAANANEISHLPGYRTKLTIISPGQTPLRH